MVHALALPVLILSYFVVILSLVQLAVNTVKKSSGLEIKFMEIMLLFLRQIECLILKNTSKSFYKICETHCNRVSDWFQSIFFPGFGLASASTGISGTLFCPIQTSLFCMKEQRTSWKLNHLGNTAGKKGSWEQCLSLERRVNSLCITIPVTRIFLFQSLKVMN